MPPRDSIPDRPGSSARRGRRPAPRAVDKPATWVFARPEAAKVRGCDNGHSAPRAHPSP
ncbi:hypothetical protein HMPREF0724_12124 [Prescottella equi ATCC 33707]|uniref:Uncharacterized protein n=1 Tax=Prescottella equi ATCC 33707 TaxID=525370 RepID=E9T1S7_RHOHA|nr:hypothetical protein HMPREF0724_12124 [Prescottella equi ATCC 33707]